MRKVSAKLTGDDRFLLEDCFTSSLKQSITFVLDRRFLGAVFLQYLGEEFWVEYSF